MCTTVSITAVFVLFPLETSKGGQLAKGRKQTIIYIPVSSAYTVAVLLVAKCTAFSAEKLRLLELESSIRAAAIVADGVIYG